MPLTRVSVMGSVPQQSQSSGFGEAVAYLLGRRYPHHTAKHVASDLSKVGMGECTIRTAENLLGGHLSAKSITRLTLAYGLGILIDAGAALTGETLEIFIAKRARAARDEQAKWDELEAQLSGEPPPDADPPTPVYPERLRRGPGVAGSAW